MARGLRRTHFNASEFERLRFALRRDPLSVLAHFQNANVHYLSELGFWATLCKQDPRLADLIRDVARMLDMPEKPERRR